MRNIRLARCAPSTRLRRWERLDLIAILIAAMLCDKNCLLTMGVTLQLRHQRLLRFASNDVIQVGSSQFMWRQQECNGLHSVVQRQKNLSASYSLQSATWPRDGRTNRILRLQSRLLGHGHNHLDGSSSNYVPSSVDNDSFPAGLLNNLQTVSETKNIRPSTSEPGQELIWLEQEGPATLVHNHATVQVEAQSGQESLVKGFPVAQSILLLNLVAIIWGSQHAVIKMVVDDSSPSAFIFLRFGLAALLAAPYTPNLLPILSPSVESDDRNRNEKHVIATTWRWGAEMGFWMFLGFAFQAIGLEVTTAQKSGFLLYLNVKFVPFLAFLLLGRQIRLATWLSALCAFAGTALLVTDGSAIDLNVGDLWSVAAAMASAMFILRLEQASDRVPNAAALNATCLWVVATMAGLWTLLTHNSGLIISSYARMAQAAAIQAPESTLEELVRIATNHPFAVIYLGGFTTALANWIQTKAQRNISAERASVIYAMDPVYGAIFAYWLLGEQLNGLTGWLGAGLITLAAATNAFVDFSQDMNQNDHKTHGDTSCR